MDIYDLMKLYYPEKKATVTRMKNKEKVLMKDALERFQVHQRNKKKGYVYAVDSADVRDYMDRLTISLTDYHIGRHDRKQLLEGIRRLCNKVDGMEAVSYKDGYYDFSWFPMTKTRSHMELCSRFVQDLCQDIISGKIDLIVSGGIKKYSQEEMNWAEKIIDFSIEFYGITSIEQLKKLYDVHPGYFMDVEDLIILVKSYCKKHNVVYLENSPKYRNLSAKGVVINEDFLALGYVDEIYRQQQGKDFYTPSLNEMQDYMEHGYFSEEPAYVELKKFLTRVNINLLRQDSPNSKKIEEMAHDIWNKYAADFELTRVINETLEVIEFRNKSQINDMIRLLIECNNNTRMQSNRGFKPNELAMETKATDIFNNKPEKAPTEKKIYPNDPCPCGSGKKYKKCCGRK